MAVYDERQSTALATTVSWLEDELREAKALIFKQQQSLEQLTAQLWENTTALHKAEDLLSTLPPRLDVLPEYDAQIRQVKDDLAGVHEQGLATAARLLELARVSHAETDRDRTVLNDHSHRLDTVERGVGGSGARLDNLDEAARRSMEVIAVTRQRQDELGRVTEGLESRLNRLVESTSHIDQDFGRIANELETLHRQDTTLAERLQIYTDALKRLEGQIALVAAEITIKQDVLERIDITRLEMTRLEERISVQEALAAELRTADEGVSHQLTMLDGRDRGLYDRLVGLQAELAAHRVQVTEQFQRLHQSQERTKRRQIEEMEREIREMRIHAFRPPEE